MRHIIMKNFLWISLALAFSACSSSPKQAGMDTELFNQGISKSGA